MRTNKKYSKSKMCIGAIQIICDTLGKGGIAKLSQNITWEVGGLAKNVMLQFLSVILLVKVKKSICYVTQEGGGRGGGEMAHRGRGLKSVEKSHVLLEWHLKAI